MTAETSKKFKKENAMNSFQVTFINQDGKRVTRIVDARHEFDAVQKAGAFNFIILSVINLDL